MKKGFLCAFEGIDGSGKTTQVKILGRRLKRLGYDFFVSKASLGGKKQSIDRFIKKFNFEKSSISTMFLFQALHTYQREKAQEALIENKVVLADRWNASFWVYHQELGPLKNCKDYLEVLDNIAFCGLVPDVTFLLDLPVTIAFQRRDGRGPRDTFEEETYEVFSLAKDAYLKMAEKDKSWVVIDASGSKREVHSAICKKIRTYILK